MHDNSTISPELIPTEKNISEETPDFSYTLWESDIRKYGFKEAGYLALFNALCRKKGCSWITSSALCDKFGDSPKTVERVLNRLEDKHLIYRNTYSKGVGKGKQRYIVVRETAILYWHNYLKNSNVPDKTRQEFLNFFFKGKPPSQELITEPSLDSAEGNLNRHNDDCLTFVTTTDEFSKENIVLTKNSSNYKTGPLKAPIPEYSLRQPQPPDPGVRQQAPTHDVVDQPLPSLPRAKEKGMEGELVSCGIRDEQLKLGMKYYELFKKTIDAKRSPVGAVLHAVRGGYAADKIQEKLHSKPSKIVPLSGGGDAEANKALAYQTKKVMEENSSEYSMRVGENCVYVSKGEKTIPLGYQDSRFKSSLEALKEKILSCNV